MYNRIMENDIVITVEWIEATFAKDYAEVCRTSTKWEWEKNLEELFQETYTKIVEDYLYRDLTAEEDEILEQWIDSK